MPLCLVLLWYYYYNKYFNTCIISGVDDFDFTRYPDKAYQLDWLRHYLQKLAEFRGENPDTVTDRDVEICYVKANKFALVIKTSIRIQNNIQDHILLEQRNLFIHLCFLCHVHWFYVWIYWLIRGVYKAISNSLKNHKIMNYIVLSIILNYLICNV